MDEDVRKAIRELAGRALADRVLLSVLTAWVIRHSPDAVKAAGWLTEIAVTIAERSDPSIIPDLREVIAKAMDLAETSP